MANKHIITWNEHHGTCLDTANGFDVIDCNSCKFKHIVPLPTAEELEKIYKYEYYTQEIPLYIQRYTEDLDWWNSVYKERYDEYENLLPSTRRRILDVGSGPGYFLLQGKERGWDTLGIEPSQRAAQHSRELGLDIIEIFLSEEMIKEKPGSFDVVNMSEVLEHVPNPKKMIEIAHQLLSPEGLFCAVVPNDYNPFQTALRKLCAFSPWWVAAPHHINYFNFDSFSNLLNLCGFEEVSRESTFPMDLFLLMGNNYIGNDNLGRLCHSQRMNFERNLLASDQKELKRALYTAFASLNIGREIKIIARKI